MRIISNTYSKYDYPQVAETLRMIAEAQKGMEGFEAGKLEEVGESMMEDMMQQFEALGEKDDYNEVRAYLICLLRKLLILFCICMKRVNLMELR